MSAMDLLGLEVLVGAVELLEVVLLQLLVFSKMVLNQLLVLLAASKMELKVLRQVQVLPLVLVQQQV